MVSDLSSQGRVTKWQKPRWLGHFWRTVYNCECPKRWGWRWQGGRGVNWTEGEHCASGQVIRRWDGRD